MASLIFKEELFKIILYKNALGFLPSNVLSSHRPTLTRILIIFHAPFPQAFLRKHFKEHIIKFIKLGRLHSWDVNRWISKSVVELKYKPFNTLWTVACYNKILIWNRLQSNMLLLKLNSLLLNVYESFVKHMKVDRWISLQINDHTCIV